MSTFFYKKGLIIFNTQIFSLLGDLTFDYFFFNKKLISFLFLSFSFLSNSIFADQLITKTEILKKSNECFNDFQYEVCRNLFLEIEKIQLVESEQDRYKCQGSILGLQTELIEAYYFRNLKNNQNGIMIPYVNKNC